MKKSEWNEKEKEITDALCDFAINLRAYIRSLSNMLMAEWKYLDTGYPCTLERVLQINRCDGVSQCEWLSKTVTGDLTERAAKKIHLFENLSTEQAATVGMMVRMCARSVLRQVGEDFRNRFEKWNHNWTKEGF